MLRKVTATVAGGQPWRKIIQRHSSVVSTAVNTMILRSLKDHYMEVTNMAPPPKVSPPADFTILEDSFDSNGPVLKRNYKNEEISISVMRLANLANDDDDDNDDGDHINQLFLHIGISKPGIDDSLHFLCGLYPDALGIHSIALRPKASEQGLVIISKKYSGPMFENLDEATRDAFHDYIEERGISESLFPFLQAWIYVKDHRNLMRWYRTVASFINEIDMTKRTKEANDAAPKGA